MKAYREEIRVMVGQLGLCSNVTQHKEHLPWDVFYSQNWLTSLSLTPGNSLVGLWLHTFTAEGLGSISGWGTKIPQATWHDKKKKKKTISLTLDLILFRKNSGLKNKLKDIVKKESNSKDHSLDNWPYSLQQINVTKKRLFQESKTELKHITWCNHMVPGLDPGWRVISSKSIFPRTIGELWI